MKTHHFTEYRHKDYRTPRSVKEAYGWDAPLHVEERQADWLSAAGWIVWIGTLGVIVAAWVMK